MKKLSNLFKAATLFVATILVAASFIGMFTAGDALAQVRPAIVKNIDEPGRIPYQQHVSAVPAPGAPCGLNFCTFTLPAVPAGKRLVITDFYGTVSLLPGGKVHSLRLIVYDKTDPLHWVTKNVFEVPPNPSAYYNVALTYNLDRYPFNVKMQMYADAGLVPTIDFWTGSANLNAEWPSEISVIGYLVDLTQ